MIGAIIGVTVGTVQAIQNCDCDYNVCQPPTGVAFPYECYTRGNSLRFTAWGYGSVTPASFKFWFYKDLNFNSANNFYTHSSPNNYIDLPGSQIVNNNVHDVALNIGSYCNNQWLLSQSDFGWYDLDELGKPYFAISGSASISAADAAYYVNGYDYNATGLVQFTPGTSVQWEILPRQPGYTATGTILFGANSPWVRVRWDGTPGFATLKCTAATSCHTEVKYYNVHISNHHSADTRSRSALCRVTTILWDSGRRDPATFSLLPIGIPTAPRPPHRPFSIFSNLSP